MYLASLYGIQLISYGTLTKPIIMTHSLQEPIFVLSLFLKAAICRCSYQDDSEEEHPCPTCVVNFSDEKSVPEILSHQRFATPVQFL
jgi:hypothetical protein